MLNKLQQFFQQHIAAHEQQEPEKCIKTATAALLLEVVYADNETADEEITALEKRLIASFDVSQAEVTEIIQLAKENIAEASDIYQFTRLVNDHFDYPKRCQLIENLWHIAIADGHIDKYEEYTIRKIADLLFVDHSDFIRTKHQAQASL